MPTKHAAFCEACEWTGPERSDNLIALADYDAHLIGELHTSTKAGLAPAIGDPITGTFSPGLTIVSIDSTADAPDTYEVRDADGTAWVVTRDKDADARAWLAV